MNLNKRKHKPTDDTVQGCPRVCPDYRTGLSAAQVEQRLRSGLCNTAPESLTKSTSRIVTGNLFNVFNILNVVLAVLIVAVGHWKNIIFLFAAACNTTISIIQELRAKHTIDRLSIVARTQVHVVRDGEPRTIDPEQLVLDDILRLDAGNQLCVDGEIVYAEGLEADESLLSGESDAVPKPAGSKGLSGSFLTAGSGYMRVTAVSDNDFASKLALEAKREKKNKSRLLRTINTIIRVLTVVIIPVGSLLLYTQYQKHIGLGTAVLGASSAMLGMIPEGLILLTGVTLAVGAMNLARRQTLVQSLPCIETLARVDVLCLDKTGTITDGKVHVTDVLPIGDFSGEQAPQAIAELMNAVGDRNPTAQALREAFPEQPRWACAHTVAFSSRRKWSGASFDAQGSYLLGAPEILFPEPDDALRNEIAQHAKQGLRVLCLAHTDKALDTDAVPAGIRCCALILLSDHVREHAPETFRFFARQGVQIKVISGDSAATVSNIAGRAGVEQAQRYVDMSRVPDGTDLHRLAEENTVFGRVTPYQKRELIRALQDNGHTACMTGDGVNDVLALREAACGVAMSGGAGAARSVADFVLLQSDFSAMVEVLKEGRRVINNIEQVASLYLVKTIYSTILSVLFMLLPLAYPFAPLQLTPVDMLAVGIPSFFLALRPNYKRPRGQFGSNVLENAAPAALLVVLNILLIQLAGVWFSLSRSETSTMSVFLIGAMSFVLLCEITRPLRLIKGLLLGALGAMLLGVFFLWGHFFMLHTLLNRNVFFYLPPALACWTLFHTLKRAAVRIEPSLRRLGRWLRGLRRHGRAQ